MNTSYKSLRRQYHLSELVVSTQLILTGMEVPCWSYPRLGIFFTAIQNLSPAVGNCPMRYKTIIPIFWDPLDDKDDPRRLVESYHDHNSVPKELHHRALDL